MPKKFKILGVNIKELSADEFWEHLHEETYEFSGDRPVDDQRWNDCNSYQEYLGTKYTVSKAYTLLGEKFARIEQE